MKLASGVGHEEEPLSDVRGARARSAEIDRPEGVSRPFHVILNKVEPSKAVLACNLFTKDRYSGWLAVLNEVEERWP